jgi:hypothetical protein
MELSAAHQSSTTPVDDHACNTGQTERRCVLFGCVEAAAWIISDPQGGELPACEADLDVLLNDALSRVPPNSRVRLESGVPDPHARVAATRSARPRPAVQPRRALSQPHPTVAPREHVPPGRGDDAMATVIQAYRYALDPTPRQRRALASHCGAARYAYNWGLQLVQQRLEQRRAGEDIEVPWTLPTLRWQWNRAKHQVASWWAENSRDAYASGLDGLARALKNFSDSKAGRRKGRPMGFPRPKRKGRCRDACRFTTGPLRVEADRHHITLPRLGKLKTHESTRKLARRLEQGTARIIAATISRTADRWFVSFTVEVQRTIPASNRKPSVVGVDVGVRHLAVLSTGQAIPTRARWSARYGSSVDSTGNFTTTSQAHHTDIRVGDDWPESTPGRPTCGVTLSTN